MSSRLWIQLFNSLRADLRQDIRRYLAFSMCLEEIAPLSHCMLTQMRSVNNKKYKSSLDIPKSLMKNFLLHLCLVERFYFNELNDLGLNDVAAISFCNNSESV